MKESPDLEWRLESWDKLLLSALGDARQRESLDLREVGASRVDEIDWTLILFLSWAHVEIEFLVFHRIRHTRGITRDTDMCPLRVTGPTHTERISRRLRGHYTTQSCWSGEAVREMLETVRPLLSSHGGREITLRDETEAQGLNMFACETHLYLLHTHPSPRRSCPHPT